MPATPSTSISICASLGYTVGLAIVTALLFGLAPAVRASRARTSTRRSKPRPRSVIGGRLRLPRFLVSIQIALCLAALVAAGLLGRTLENLKWMDVGFDRDNLAYASVSPSRAGYSTERTRTIYRSRARSARQAARRRQRKPRLDAIAVRRWEQRPRELSWTPLGRCEPIEPEYGWRRVLRNAAHASRRRQDVRTPRHAAERRRGGRRPGVCANGTSRTRIRWAAALDSIRNDNNHYEIVGVVGNSLYMSMRSDGIQPSTNPIVRGARSTLLSARRWTPALLQKLFDRRSQLSIRRSHSQSFIPKPG